MRRTSYRLGMSGVSPVPVYIGTSGFTITKSSEPVVSIFGDASGVNVKLTALEGWDKPNRLSWIDNSAPYNKLYMNYTVNSTTQQQSMNQCEQSLIMK